MTTTLTTSEEIEISEVVIHEAEAGGRRPIRRQQRTTRAAGSLISMETKEGNSEEMVGNVMTSEEPSFITSSPRFSPRRGRTATALINGTLTSPTKEKEPPSSSSSSLSPTPEESDRKGVRSSQRLQNLSSKNKKDKALFSPLFVRLRHKRREGESDTSEPVTPESQIDVGPEKHLKAKKSLREMLERESGPQSPEKVAKAEDRSDVDSILEMEAITYSDDEQESMEGSSDQTTKPPVTTPEVGTKGSQAEISPAAPEEEDEEVDAEEEMLEFDPYYFIRSLPPLTPLMLARTCDIPAKSEKHPRHTLVLDLDETLVHCTTTPIPNPDLIFPVEFNGEKFQVYVLKRPHLETFLEAVSKLFEVIIFTASQQIYADALLNLIDKEKAWIHHRLFRESCLCIEGNYLKELSVLKRDLSKTIIVDNSPQAFGYQVDNGIPIISWYEDKQDKELLEILSFLKTLVEAEDVRPQIREKYQLHKKIEANPIS